MKIELGQIWEIANVAHSKYLAKYKNDIIVITEIFPRHSSMYNIRGTLIDGNRLALAEYDFAHFKLVSL